jgi:hypothetical protein
MMEAKTRDRDGAVMTCTVEDCSYNMLEECRAPRIEVGGKHPYCDTYTREEAQLAEKDAFVAACMTEQCSFNQEERCVARGITLDCHDGHADCATYRA